jgi:putative transposase
VKRRRGNYWNNAPVVQYFKRSNTGWFPTLGYRHITDTQQSITEYLIGHFNQTRPHKHNDGLSPNAAEEVFEISH